MKHLFVLASILAVPLASTADAQVGGRVGILRDHLPPSSSGYSNFGAGIDGAGDVDGDGFDDIIVSCLGQAVAVVYSGKDGSALHWITTPGTTFRATVAGIGDIDADGLSDFAIGDSNGGTVSLFSGADASLLYTLNNGQSSSRFGSSIASLGDLTGDGVPDFAVAAEYALVGSLQRCGSVYVYSGATGALVLRVDGDMADAELGTHVNDAGDVNGDGTPDLLAVAVRDSQPSGGYGATIVYSGLDGSQLFRVTGETLLSGTWMHSDGIGDVDGDGFDDIAVGDHSTIMPWDRRGVVTVYSGATEAPLWEWSGADDQRVGMDVDGTGDLNGDGIPDLIVGIHGDLGGAPNRPRRSAMLLTGDRGKFLARLSDNHPDNSIRFGHRVTAVGDINGDGHTEFAIGDSSHGLMGRVLVYGFNPQMTASTNEVSVSLGGTVDLEIDFPRLDAGQSYAVLASLHGTGPYQSPGIRIPLTPDHVFRDSEAGQYPFAVHSGMHGLLDPEGDASAQIVFQPQEVSGWMVGRTFYLAATTSDVSGVTEKSSIVVGIGFLP